MDNRTEVREFLISRRAMLTPQDVGLPAAGNRRVPGLRRSEVAALAGVSVEYYAKLERGQVAGASKSVRGWRRLLVFAAGATRERSTGWTRLGDGALSPSLRNPTGDREPRSAGGELTECLA